ncbi:MBL fold metallo-hydrolase [Pedobacter xixiisoli]|uniref:L-ascorbate metabolism protein UlaG, beta-lactamase superfamily n=1 Tax=Pedobacter xixiisoli TaxID=1476464 RepID=A0A286ADX8_9SPHI|nr:MBL fold metallo-hydrolase [Pedobacter xixiisoli]SOD20106.1 L-ascorbate metabolism protein UlaG, beta-lactamase superfamily [Pedobacter xixiisoli]
MKKTFKIFKYTMIFFLSLALILAISTYFYMRLPKFGKAPSGQRLALLAQSPNYKDGKFQNFHYTPDLTEGYSMLGIMFDMLFKNHPRRKPVDSLPSVKTDLLNLSADSNVLVWFGHSSYFMQIEGKRFLVDPVFSGNASPIPGTTKSFKGADIYSVADLPHIDYLLISHDHYDHLDYETIIALKNKVGKVICGLGVGEHFEYWGYSPQNLIEKDWNQKVDLGNGFTLNTVPGRHFSGRGFKRNNTLWTSYLLETPKAKIFIGGDSGYDTHFKEIGNQFGPIDLAILENGQYNVAWQAIHTLPEETVKAAKDLKAKRFFPVHSSKFMLAMHQWDEPLNDVTKINNGEIPMVTPMIGEVVNLNDEQQVFTQWWKGVK